MWMFKYKLMSFATLRQFLILNEKEVKDYLKWVFIINSSFYVSLMTGRWLQDKSSSTTASWGTPKFVSSIPFIMKFKSDGELWQASHLPLFRSALLARL
jgi:hypothetical protein